MKLNTVQEFKIDYNERKNCKLVDNKGKRINTYYIKKLSNGFTASNNKARLNDLKISDQRSSDDDYLGYIICEEAYIDFVHVSGDDTDKLLARQCGIGSTLSALCMIDKDVNRGDGVVLNVNRINKEYEFSMSKMSEAKVNEIVKEIKKECKNLIGLLMAAAGGGNSYFEAARMARYGQMVLLGHTKEREWISLDLEDAQTCFNKNEFRDPNWVFCKGAKSSNPPSRTPLCSILKR